jgi:ABC-type sugar transport system substrate-binding protein
MSNLDTANQLIQKQAVEDYVKEKGLKGGIVDVRETLGDNNKALDVSSSMLAAYPEINVILAFTGEGGACAAQSAAEINRNVVIIGMDDSEYTLTAIRNGIQFASMAQNCYKWGYYSTKMAFLASVGRLNEMESTVIDSGVVMITKDNLDTYADELFVMP